MKVASATFIASSLSGVALLICLIACFHIFSNVQDLFDELDEEMNGFRVTTDDMWREMMSLGQHRAKREQYASASAGNYGDAAVHAPAVEAGPACQCDVDRQKKCPSGATGPKGVPGKPGPNGFSGLDGKDGHDAEDVSPSQEEHNSCFYCPPGPRGGPGPMGTPGFRGMKGEDGREGRPGKDGHPGLPGSMGAGGVSGRPGPEGKMGDKGMDGRKPIGRPGHKGLRGAPGDVGPQGAPGSDGPTGQAGPSGPSGPSGGPGPGGVQGGPGPEGKDGRVGRDAEYCPCPERKHGGGGGGGGGRGGNAGYAQPPSQSYKRN